MGKLDTGRLAKPGMHDRKIRARSFARSVSRLGPAIKTIEAPRIATKTSLERLLQVGSVRPSLALPRSACLAWVRRRSSVWRGAFPGDSRPGNAAGAALRAVTLRPKALEIPDDFIGMTLRALRAVLASF
jgi:hypothetical protein